MLYIPSWTTRTSWNHNYKLYVEARSRTDLIITFNVDSDIVDAHIMPFDATVVLSRWYVSAPSEMPTWMQIRNRQNP